MAQSIRVDINPDVLRWARELGGYTVDDLAKAAGAKPERFEDWESGRSRPTIGQLRKVADRLRRPSAFFMLPEVPVAADLPRPPDFRSATDRHEPSSALRRELRLAVERRERFLDIAGEVPPWNPGISLDDEERAGLVTRELLGITVEGQLAARDPYAALAMWIGAIESLGALVFQSSTFDIDEARGASIHFSSAPLILLNAKDPPVARCFTVMHELGHLLMGSGALCEVYGQGLGNVERRCNRFAAATLMPADALLEEFRRPISDDGAVDEVWRIGRRFKVSGEAAAIRLRDLGQVSDAVVSVVRRATRDRRPTRDDDGPPRIPVSTIKLRDLGRSYVGAVLEAYHADRITLTDVSQYLGTKVQHVEKMEQRLLGAKGEETA